MSDRIIKKIASIAQESSVQASEQVKEQLEQSIIRQVTDGVINDLKQYGIDDLEVVESGLKKTAQVEDSDGNELKVGDKVQPVGRILLVPSEGEYLDVDEVLTISDITADSKLFFTTVSDYKGPWDGSQFTKVASKKTAQYDKDILEKIKERYNGLRILETDPECTSWAIGPDGKAVFEFEDGSQVGYEEMDQKIMALGSKKTAFKIRKQKKTAREWKVKLDFGFHQDDPIPEPQEAGQKAATELENKKEELVNLLGEDAIIEELIRRFREDVQDYDDYDGILSELYDLGDEHSIWIDSWGSTLKTKEPEKVPNIPEPGVPEDKLTKEDFEASKKTAQRPGRGLGPGDGLGIGGTDICVCPECGYEETHEKGVPCSKYVCPVCAGDRGLTVNLVGKGMPHGKGKGAGKKTAQVDINIGDKVEVMDLEGNTTICPASTVVDVDEALGIDGNMYTTILTAGSGDTWYSEEHFKLVNFSKRSSKKTAVSIEIKVSSKKYNKPILAVIKEMKDGVVTKIAYDKDEIKKAYDVGKFVISIPSKGRFATEAINEKIALNNVIDHVYKDATPTEKARLTGEMESGDVTVQRVPENVEKEQPVELKPITVVYQEPDDKPVSVNYEETEPEWVGSIKDEIGKDVIAKQVTLTIAASLSNQIIAELQEKVDELEIPVTIVTIDPTNWSAQYEGDKTEGEFNFEPVIENEIVKSVKADLALLKGKYAIKTIDIELGDRTFRTEAKNEIRAVANVLGYLIRKGEELRWDGKRLGSIIDDDIIKKIAEEQTRIIHVYKTPNVNLGHWDVVEKDGKKYFTRK
jgi:hypothetical protein